MNTNNLLIQYDKDLRMRIMYPEARREVTGDVVRFIRKAPDMNVVSFTFATERQLDRVIDGELDYFAPMGQPFTWKVYDHDLLPSLKQRLASRGFVGNAPCYIMALDMNSARSHVHAPRNADLRRLTAPEDLKHVVQILNGALGSDHAWVADRLAMYLELHSYLSVYAAYVEGQPASVAWTYFPHGRFATLFGGATLPAYRRGGLYTGLLSTQLEEIRGRNYPFTVLKANAMNKPILEEYGFQHLTTVWDYAWLGN